eukprot:TRINITY_DN15281_c0_g1_i1.p1 TRINITY_DN15281_c0_g1~~TRINITY_DN15281_c0_g1_i1.p1  ORF type:complete len:296 (+),score=73.29 TRINITY_DN15281_c0_g1_i1:33-890(+)
MAARKATTDIIPPRAQTTIPTPTTPSTPPRSPSTDLNATTSSLAATRIADRFAGFHSALEETKLQKRLQEDARSNSILLRLDSMEKTFKEEAKKRQEQMRALQTLFDSRISAAVESLQTQITAITSPYTVAIERLTNRVESMERTVAEQQVRVTTELAQSTQGIGKQFSDLHSAISEERTTRVDREAMVLKKISDESYKLQERVNQERVNRESALTQLSSEFTVSASARKKSDERFQSKILDDITQFKQTLAEERAAREQAEAHLLAAIEDVVHNLQGAVQIANS